MSMKEAYNRGYLGEQYVMFELAIKGLRSQKMNSYIDFDILVENGARIEVKTSTLKRVYHKKHKATWVGWIFSNHASDRVIKNGVKQIVLVHRDRACDFFAFVCLDKKAKNVVKTIVAPKDVIGTRRTISIPKEFKRKAKLARYENKWGLISKFSKCGLNDTDVYDEFWKYVPKEAYEREKARTEQYLDIPHIADVDVDTDIDITGKKGLRRPVFVSDNQYFVTIPKHLGQAYKLKDGTLLEFTTRWRDEITMEIVKT